MHESGGLASMQEYPYTSLGGDTWACKLGPNHPYKVEGFTEFAWRE
jgi:hypothetical protein